MSLRIGLTGGIGCGKSTVASLFQQFGADIVDADTLVHQLTQPGAIGATRIQETFGMSFFQNGELQRNKLRQFVFANPTAREQLEEILHPLVRDEILRHIASWRAPYGIAVIPLLLEKGHWAKKFDRILVIDCSEETQIQRVQKRSSLSRAEIIAIMTTQVSRATRLAAADDIIDNDGAELDALFLKVEHLDHHFRHLAAMLPHQLNRG